MGKDLRVEIETVHDHDALSQIVARGFQVKGSSHGDRNHAQMAFLEQRLDLKETLMIGPPGQTDKEPVLHPKHIATLQISWRQNPFDVLVRSEGFTNRLHLSPARLHPRSGDNGPLPNDNGRVLHKGAVRVSSISGNSDQFKSQLGEGITVSSMLEPCQLNIDLLRIVPRLDALIKGVRDLSDKSESAVPLFFHAFIIPWSRENGKKNPAMQ